MQTFWQDFRYGWRLLRRNGSVTLVAVLSLAIGIGANSAIFSVVNSLLLRPLPYLDAERLVILWNRSPGLNVEQDWFSLGQYLDVKIENHVFDQVAVTLGSSYNLTGNGLPEHLEGARVSSSLFPLLGAQAMLGRNFLPEDDEKGKSQTVILSYGLWQRRFGGDREVIGKTLLLNDQGYSIIGVMPSSFSLDREIMPTVNGIQRADILLPLPVSDADRTKRGGEDYNIFARLKPGITVAQAQADMDVIAGQMKRQYPENYPANGGLTLSVVSLLEQVVGNIRRILYLLLGAVGLVLLIACTNIANLLLARAAVRQNEMAIRSAVGASRGRILRQLLTESILLALFGGALGIAIALVSNKILRLFGSAKIPRLQEINIDGRVLAFTFLITLLTGIIFGLAPSLRASKVSLNEVLKESGRGIDGSRHHRLRNLLVVAEIALSLVLLIGAGLFIRSYRYIAAANPGFNPHNVLSLRLTLPNIRYSTPESVNNFHQQLNRKIRQLPGVEFVGSNFSLPLSSNSAAWGPVTVEGYVPKAASELIISNERFISPDFLRAMGMPLIKGRQFDEHDIKGAPDVCLVNEQFAARFWPNEDPLGKRIQRGGQNQWRTVVGIVRDEKEFSLENEPPISIYHPIDQFAIRSRYLVVRTAADPVALVAAITGEIRALDSQLPVYEVNTMEQRLSAALAQRRFAMLLLGLFAGIAMILAAIGIYGVVSYWVSQRTHEIGIRMALGAQPGNILQMILRQVSILIAIGIGIGLAGALILLRLMSGLLAGIHRRDGFTFVLIALFLAGVALLASYLPARRAAAVDPMIALRSN